MTAFLIKMVNRQAITQEQRLKRIKRGINVVNYQDFKSPIRRRQFEGLNKDNIADYQGFLKEKKAKDDAYNKQLNEYNQKLAEYNKQVMLKEAYDYGAKIGIDRPEDVFVIMYESDYDKKKAMERGYADARESYNAYQKSLEDYKQQIEDLTNEGFTPIIENGNVIGFEDANLKMSYKVENTDDLYKIQLQSPKSPIFVAPEFAGINLKPPEKYQDYGFSEIPRKKQVWDANTFFDEFDNREIDDYNYSYKVQDVEPTKLNVDKQKVVVVGDYKKPSTETHYGKPGDFYKTSNVFEGITEGKPIIRGGKLLFQTTYGLFDKFGKMVDEPLEDWVNYWEKKREGLKEKSDDLRGIPKANKDKEDYADEKYNYYQGLVNKGEMNAKEAQQRFNYDTRTYNEKREKQRKEETKFLKYLPSWSSVKSVGYDALRYVPISPGEAFKVFPYIATGAGGLKWGQKALKNAPRMIQSSANLANKGLIAYDASIILGDNEGRDKALALGSLGLYGSFKGAGGLWQRTLGRSRAYNKVLAEYTAKYGANSKEVKDLKSSYQLFFKEMNRPSTTLKTFREAVKPEEIVSNIKFKSKFAPKEGWLGRFNVRTKEITLNKGYIRNWFKNNKSRINTLIHEKTHALDPLVKGSKSVFDKRGIKYSKYSENIMDMVRKDWKKLDPLLAEEEMAFIRRNYDDYDYPTEYLAKFAGENPNQIINPNTKTGKLLSELFKDAKIVNSGKVFQSKVVKSISKYKRAQQIVDDNIRDYGKRLKIIGTSGILPQVPMKKLPRGLSGDIDMTKGSTEFIKNTFFDLRNAGYDVKLFTSRFGNTRKWHLNLDGKELINMAENAMSTTKAQLAKHRNWNEFVKAKFVKDPLGVQMLNIRDQMRAKFWAGYIEKSRPKDIIDVRGVMRGIKGKRKLKEETIKEIMKIKKENPNIIKVVKNDKGEIIKVIKQSRVKEYDPITRKFKKTRKVKRWAEDYNYNYRINKIVPAIKTPYKYTDEPNRGLTPVYDDPYNPKPYNPYPRITKPPEINTPYIPDEPKYPPTIIKFGRGKTGENVKRIPKIESLKEKQAYQVVYVDNKGNKMKGQLFPNEVEASSRGIDVVDNSELERFYLDIVEVDDDADISRYGSTKAGYKFKKKKGMFIEKVPYRYDKPNEKKKKVVYRNLQSNPVLQRKLFNTQNKKVQSYKFNIMPYVFGSTR